MEITKVVKPFIRRGFVIYINFMIYIFVNIYLQILKYIKNLYFCQSLEFVVVFWCFLNCLLLQIMLHKCLSLSRALCVCVCVCVCYVYPFTLLCIYFLWFYLPKSKKCPAHRCHTCVWERVNMLVPCCLCALVLVPNLCMDIFQIYASFVDFIWQFL